MATEKAPYRPISCIVREQPLPVLRYEELDDPGYFPASSSGYKAGDEGGRACEDISQLLRYAQTINSTIWDIFLNSDIAKKVNALNVEGLEMREEWDYTEKARALCFLFGELLAEAQRRFSLLDKWVTAQWLKDQRDKHPGSYPAA